MTNPQQTGAQTDTTELAVNTIRGLSIDAVQAANSGHPGMPMGMADVAWVIWHEWLKHDPSDPNWPDRDRFVLSAGHGSMLIYSLLHLFDYGLELEQIKQFRQWGSETPGHPEYGHTVGVETTTGPLGQGLCNGVGMAIAERKLRTEFGAEVCDHRVFAIVSDGDLMEGVASEAASLAGHLALGRLVYLYDDNSISIDGSTDISFSEDRAARFESYGWHVQTVDGHDRAAISAAIAAAVAEEGKPSIICCKTLIGKGSPSKEGSEKSHGSPLGVDEVRATKLRLGLNPDEHFAVPAEVLALARGKNAARKELREQWEQRMRQSPHRATWEAWHARPDSSKVEWPVFETSAKGTASRKASAAALNAAAAGVPQLIGGSADLTGSNGALITDTTAITASDFSGRMLYWGVREHAMGAICNGMALHGGTLPFNATFLVFHDYMRPSVRLAALMKQQVLFIYTHDSFYLGEDGPTHQPIEQLMAMRLIPGLVTIRPADANETVEAWKMAVDRETGPTALVLTRQNLPTVDRGVMGAASGLRKGAYVLSEAQGELQAVLIATGSEVGLALEAQALLQSEGIGARVVSMPSWELFELQDSDYKASVLPAGAPRVSVEAGRTFGWERWVGWDGASVGIDHYGGSAPAAVLAEKFGFTPEKVAEAVRGVLA